MIIIVLLQLQTRSRLAFDDWNDSTLRASVTIVSASTRANSSGGSSRERPPTIGKARSLALGSSTIYSSLVQHTLLTFGR